MYVPRARLSLLFFFFLFRFSLEDRDKRLNMVVMVPRLGKRENKCRGVDILIGERER